MKKTDLPLVSICLPVYNAAKYLPVCLKSIADQTYSNIELIAVDDCSTDESLSILKKFQKNHKWVRIYRNAKNSGISPTFNLAIAKARGQFLARMDADDAMYPNRLNEQVAYLQNHPETVIVGGQCTIINGQDQVIGKKTFPKEHSQIYSMLFRTVPMQLPTVMINRSLLPADFIYSDARFTPAEEFDLFFSAAKYGQLHNLPQYVHYYREHGTNTSLKHPKRTFWAIWKARIDGVVNFSYRPSLYSLAVVAAQTAAILLLPEKVIYPLHKLLRGMNHTVAKTEASHIAYA